MRKKSEEKSQREGDNSSCSSRGKKRIIHAPVNLPLPGVIPLCRPAPFVAFVFYIYINQPGLP